MDFELHGVSVSRSLYISGLSGSETQDEIVAALDKYGTITKVVKLQTKHTGEPIAIVEFSSEAPILGLEPDFPVEIPSAANVQWVLDSISNLPELQPAVQVRHVPENECRGSDSDSSSDTSASTTLSPHKALVSASPTPLKSSQKARKPRQVTPEPLSTDMLNPPDIQRVVVEHVIRNESLPAQSYGSKWLRTFSGKTPKPPGEVDFETWCLHVELMFQDHLPVDAQRRKILESLLPPAATVVKQLGPSAHPEQYVTLLESAYGFIEDGEEIFAKFLNTHQNSGEKPSDYLQRLQVLLGSAIKRGGVEQSNAKRHLLKQFIRGCWDHTLILSLQLEAKLSNPPDFAQFLLLLRTEEDRRSSKLERMQRHFSNSKQKPSLNFHSALQMSPQLDPHAEALQKYMSETEQLRKELADVKLQLREQRSKKEKNQDSLKHTNQESFSGVQVNSLSYQAPHRPRAVPPVHQAMPPSQPKAWFCFRCGQDGHIARQCVEAMNKSLVDLKYKELRAKQDEWKLRHGQSLNRPGSQ